MAAHFLEYPAAAISSFTGQGALVRDQHCNVSRRNMLDASCERIHLRGKSALHRSEWLGDRSIAHVRTTQKRGPVRKQIHVRAGLEELASNQILVSAVAASTLGQIAKPFAAALAGKGFNWKLTIKSGGMPSSHSAAVTAAATALAFERGLSDGVFGLSVILAGIVMYDAQGVRNAVGKQAKVINTMVVSYVPLLQSELQTSAPIATPSPAAIGSELARDPVEAELAFLENLSTPSPTPRQVPSITATLEESSPGPSKKFETSNGAYVRSTKFFELAEQLPTMKVGEVDIQELGNQDGWRLLPLKESIGHTKVEVLVGGIWGVVITYILHFIYNP